MSIPTSKIDPTIASHSRAESEQRTGEGGSTPDALTSGDNLDKAGGGERWHSSEIPAVGDRTSTELTDYKLLREIEKLKKEGDELRTKCESLASQLMSAEMRRGREDRQEQDPTLHAKLKRAEQIRQLTLNRCHQFRTSFEELLRLYQTQRAWKIMLWFRKGYSLWFSSPIRGKFRFLQFLLTSPWKGFAGLSDYDLGFPSLSNYMPRQIMSSFEGDGEAAGSTSPRAYHDAVYGDSNEVALRRPRRYDVIILGIIDFETRFQRPQQIAAQFARSGHRVLWVSTTRFLPASSDRPYELFELRDGLWEVRLRGPQPDIYLGSLSPEMLDAFQESLHHLYRDCGVVESCVIVQIPFWRRLALSLRKTLGSVILYDCMDEWETFPNIGPFNLAEERHLAEECDVLAVTAKKLVEKFAQGEASPVLVRNGADFNFFSAPASTRLLPADIPRPVIGYFGAIAEWVDLDLLYRVAQARPQYTFVVIGQVFGRDTSRLERLRNVHLLGFKAYEEIPIFLRDFDACIIPFLINRVTSATDPVKMYEYFSQGKPVVATDMPELNICGDLLYVARDAVDFAEKLDSAVSETDVTLRARRIEFARTNTWTKRVEDMSTAVERTFPLVSILVVTYNSAEFVDPCIESIFRNTTYPNIEVILVDNGSTDDTVARIRPHQDDPRLRLFGLEENLGFAGGNNFAARQASGEHLIFLNPDTLVTTGWIEYLLRHVRRDNGIGLLTAVTNFAGNEIKINVDYRNQSEMETFAAYVNRSHFGENFDIRVAPLYCVLMTKRVWDRIGVLDERFGMGMFEDDDLAMRVRAEGLRVAAARDCFIHHFGQGSFAKLPSEEYERIFDRNRSLFESKWKEPWQPHQPAPGVRPAHAEERFVPSLFCGTDLAAGTRASGSGT